jgi:hypothetical protein
MSKPLALIICFFTGSIGLHFVYMGHWDKVGMRLIWFFFCNPVAFVRSWIDCYKLYKMNDYQFKSHCMKRVRGTETEKGLKKFINDKF